MDGFNNIKPRNSCRVCIKQVPVPLFSIFHDKARVKGISVYNCQVREIKNRLDFVIESMAILCVTIRFAMHFEKEKMDYSVPVILRISCKYCYVSQSELTKNLVLAPA